jgi:hypothetical protein
MKQGASWLGLISQESGGSPFRLDETGDFAAYFDGVWNDNDELDIVNHYFYLL